MHTIVVRTLRHEYRIGTESSDVAKSMAYAEARPEMEGFELEPVEITVESEAGTHRVDLPNGGRAEGAPLDVLEGVCRLVYFGVEDEEPGAPLIHGASIRLNGQRILLVGRSGFGKTTFTLYLLANGMDVEGDERIVVREGDMVVWPRALRVKPSSILLVPKLAATVLAAPKVTLEWGGDIHEVYAVAPSLAGRPWRIAAGRVHHIVFMEPNHGGRSSLALLPREDAFRRLMEDCGLPAGAVGAATVRLRRATTEAKTWLLTLGDLAEAEWQIRNIAG